MKGSAAETGGLRIDVSRTSERKKPPEDDERTDTQKKIARLFEQLGGQGKIKVYEVVEKGDPEFVTTLKVDASIFEELEERIGHTCGGGVYKLQGLHGSTYIAGTSISISKKTYPPQPAKTAAGDPAKPGASTMEVMLLQMQLQQQQQQMQSQAQAAAQQGQMFATMLQMQDQGNLRQLELVKALGGGHAAAGSPSAGVGQMVEYAKLFKALGWGSQNGHADGSNLPPGLQLLAAPLTSLANAFGDKVGTAVARKISPPPGPALQVLPQLAPAQPPTPITSAPAPTAEDKGPGAEMIKRPPAGAPVQMPPGVRLFKPGAVPSHKSAPVVGAAMPEALRPLK